MNPKAAAALYPKLIPRGAIAKEWWDDDNNSKSRL